MLGNSGIVVRDIFNKKVETVQQTKTATTIGVFREGYGIIPPNDTRQKVSGDWRLLR